jgi:hypothetical protein
LHAILTRSKQFLELRLVVTRKFPISHLLDPTRQDSRRPTSRRDVEFLHDHYDSPKALPARTQSIFNGNHWHEIYG